MTFWQLYLNDLHSFTKWAFSREEIAVLLVALTLVATFFGILIIAAICEHYVKKAYRIGLRRKAE